MVPEAPPGLLETVSELSRRFGSDPEFARGGGGNSSGKAGGVLWIKPSGVSLASLTPDRLMPLDMAPLLAMLKPDAPPAPPGSDPVLRVGMAARLDAADRRRPSVEALFHALLPEPIVVHSHPTLINAVTCASRGEEVARELFGDEVLWIPYTDPGLPLARRIAAERDAIVRRTGRPAPGVLLLGNHGLVVAGRSADGIAERTDQVVAAVRDRLARANLWGAPGASPAGDAIDRLAMALAASLAARGRGASVVPDASPVAQWVASTSAGRVFVAGGPLTPDQIVYAGSWPLLVEGPPSDTDGGTVLAAAMERHEVATGERPSIVVVDGVGLLAIATSRTLAATARDVYLDAARIAAAADFLGGVRPMAAAERRFIDEWEAEAYRRGVAAGPVAEPGSDAVARSWMP